MSNPRSRGQQRDKPYRDALRMELASAGDNLKELRAIARMHIEAAKAGDMAAIKELADRMDGKPAQESHVTLEKRDATDWTRDELVKLLGDTPDGGTGAAAPDGRGGESDSVH